MQTSSTNPQYEAQPPSTADKMTDHSPSDWDESSTNPAAMPATSASGAVVATTDAGTTAAPAAKPEQSTSTAVTESNLSTSLSELDISSKSHIKPLQESLLQSLPSSPPAPAPPPKDRRLPAPEDVLAKAKTAQQKPSPPSPPLPAVPNKGEPTTATTSSTVTTGSGNDRLHPGYSAAGQQQHPHHHRSLSGSSILDGDEEENTDSKGEIRSIMSQFSPKITPQSDDPQAEKTGDTDSSLPNPPLSPIPPRTSSLENLMTVDRSTPRSPISEKTSNPLSPTLTRRFSKNFDPSTPTEPTPPLPAPDPEPPLPFDFHRFLEQLRHRTADPVAKFLRSFLNEFGKRQWQVHEQVKIISDFLEFIHGKMAVCDVWREVSDAEFDNAKEGMEKLVMNRLYTQTFSPAIPSPSGGAGSKSRSKRRENPNMPGRRGQHQEDVERDEILAQKVAIYGWVREEHLDIKPVGESGRKFLSLACQELLKIKNYRAPRDKVICVLNCCKVIFGLLRHANSTQSADDFVPLLIYVVLQANPEHIVSNIQYILRFRNPDKLGGEAGYYLSSLSGAIQFIEGLDRNSLTVSDDGFERNVEEAVKKIAEKQEPISPVVSSTPRGSVSGEAGRSISTSTTATATTEDVSRRKSAEGRKSTSSRTSDRGGNALSEKESGNGSGSTAGGEEERAAVAGLLRTIQKPLSTIGRIFGDDGSSSQQQSSQQPPPRHTLQPNAVESGPVGTPLPGNTPRTSPAPGAHAAGQQEVPTNGFPGARAQFSDGLAAAESAARQASAETAEAMRIQRAEHENVVGSVPTPFAVPASYAERKFSRAPNGYCSNSTSTAGMRTTTNSTASEWLQWPIMQLRY